MSFVARQTLAWVFAAAVLIGTLLAVEVLA